MEKRKIIMFPDPWYKLNKTILKSETNNRIFLKKEENV